jgi:hypothetical protein
MQRANVCCWICNGNVLLEQSLTVSPERITTVPLMRDERAGGGTEVPAAIGDRGLF